MLGFLGRGRKQPKSEVFGQLTIERRVLITPRSTVSIPNIATISSGTITVPSKLVWMLALMLLAGGIGVFAYARARPGFVDAAAGSAMVLAALVLARFFSHKEKPCLFISSSDGHTSLFAGQQKTLEEVRRLLSDKINADDENAVYRINFEKGVVQTVNVAPGASVGAIVAGSGNHVMAGAGSARLGTPILSCRRRTHPAPSSATVTTPRATAITPTTRRCCPTSRRCSAFTPAGRIRRISPTA
jgi:hypothetical protein